MYSLVPFQEFLNAVSIDGKRCSRYRAPKKGGSCGGMLGQKSRERQHQATLFGPIFLLVCFSSKLGQDLLFYESQLDLAEGTEMYNSN